MIHLIFITTGLCVGFLSGMFGIGGGIIILPILYFCFNHLLLLKPSLAFVVASATSLSIIIPTLTMTVIARHRESNIRWYTIKNMLPGVIFGALISTIWLHHILNPLIIQIIYSLSCVLIAIQIYFKLTLKLATKPTTPKAWEAFTAGLTIGSISSILGISGGEYTASFFSYHRFDIRQVTGTTAVVGLTIAVFGTLGFLICSKQHQQISNLPFSVGYIYMPAVIQICITSLIMASLGAKLVQKVKPSLKRKYFALIIISTGIMMPFI